jgi:hypothetical protein
MESLNITLPQLKDLTTVAKKFQDDGYTHNFKATEEGLLQCLETEEYSSLNR